MLVLESVIPSNPSFQVRCPQEIGTTDFTDETDFQIRRLRPGEDEALPRIRRIRRMKIMIRELPSVRMDQKATERPVKAVKAVTKSQRRSRKTVLFAEAVDGFPKGVIAYLGAGAENVIGGVSVYPGKGAAKRNGQEEAQDGLAQRGAADLHGYPVDDESGGDEQESVKEQVGGSHRVALIESVPKVVEDFDAEIGEEAGNRRDINNDNKIEDDRDKGDAEEGEEWDEYAAAIKAPQRRELGEMAWIGHGWRDGSQGMEGDVGVVWMKG